MKTVVFEVWRPAGRAKAKQPVAKPARHALRSFGSVEEMARTMTPTRWALLQALAGAGPLGVRELARRAARDVKGVHTDANALVAAGVIDRTDDGKYSFPFNTVKVRFELRAAK